MRSKKTRLRLALAMLRGAGAGRRHRCLRRQQSSSSPAAAPARPKREGESERRLDRLQPRKRHGQPDDRLEELPRTGNPRGNLRPGAGRGRLQGEERPQPRLRNRRPQSGQDRADLRLPGVRQHGADLVLRPRTRRSPRRRDRSVGKGERRIRKGRPRRLRTDPVRQRQRGRPAEDDGGKVRTRKRSPTSKASPKNSRLYGSPECRQRIDCLAGLEKLYGLKFKSFTPGRHRPPLHGAGKGSGGSLDPLHHRPAALGGERTSSSSSKTTSTSSRPAT